MNNRELKFRIWDKKSVCWVSDYENAVNQNRLKFFIDLTGKIGKIIYPLYEGDGSEDNVVNPENYVIQQYTGQKDKNNVDIYEGDIVTFKERPRISERGEFEDREGYERKNVLIFWDNKECGFRFKLNNYRQSEKILYESIEVIGNIFETPELLLK